MRGLVRRPHHVDALRDGLEPGHGHRGTGGNPGSQADAAGSPCQHDPDATDDLDKAHDDVQCSPRHTSAETVAEFFVPVSTGNAGADHPVTHHGVQPVRPLAVRHIGIDQVFILNAEPVELVDVAVDAGAEEDLARLDMPVAHGVQLAPGLGLHLFEAADRPVLIIGHGPPAQIPEI